MTALQSSETAALLDAVDKLRTLGSLSQEISLPQIIVVGQQSSGKSSVLEAISGIKFPVNDALTTQFAIEVILRRAPERRHRASINAVNPTDSQKERLAEFARDYENVNLHDLPTIVQKAKECMGLGDKDLSEDKLRLEIFGPDQDHLTLVDLPGVIAASGQGQSVNIAAIRNLVLTYMKQPLSMILTVVNAHTDWENQGILELLKEVARGQERALGVITALDTIDVGSPKENTFKALAENNVIPLGLGWHLLRNLSFSERAKGMNRDDVEHDFFTTKSPWRFMPKDVLGITTFRTRLTKVLHEKIASQLGSILNRIEEVIEDVEGNLDKLGDARSTTEEQRAFLIKISTRYEYLTNCALEGEYRDSFFEQHDRNRLRARIANANIKFASRMVKNGHRWIIEDQLGAEGTESRNRNEDSTDRCTPRSELVAIVHEMQKTYRGRELYGTFHPSLIGRLFKRQAQHWESIATSHLRRSFGFVKRFLEDLFQHIAGKERATILLKHVIDPAMESKEKKLKKKLDELLHPYISGNPMTLNARYITTLQEMQAKRLENESTDEYGVHDFDQFGCEQAIDIMQSYYQVALTVFVDNVAMLAIEGSLLSDLAKLITPVTIANESPQRLAVLGSESPETAALRQRLQQKLDIYQDGRRAIFEHVRRRAHVMKELAGATVYDDSTSDGDSDGEDESQDYDDVASHDEGVSSYKIKSESMASHHLKDQGTKHDTSVTPGVKMSDSGANAASSFPRKNESSPVLTTSTVLPAPAPTSDGFGFTKTATHPAGSGSRVTPQTTAKFSFGTAPNTGFGGTASSTSTPTPQKSSPSDKPSLYATGFGGFGTSGTGFGTSQSSSTNVGLFGQAQSAFGGSSVGQGGSGSSLFASSASESSPFVRGSTNPQTANSPTGVLENTKTTFKREWYQMPKPPPEIARLSRNRVPCAFDKQDAYVNIVDEILGEILGYGRPSKSPEEVHLEDWNVINSEATKQWLAECRAATGRTDWNHMDAFKIFAHPFIKT